MPIVDRVYAVIKYDISMQSQVAPDDQGYPFAIVQVMQDEEEAEREVNRLNALSDEKLSRYSIQSARWYPLGRVVTP